MEIIMQRFLVMAAAGVLALAVQGDSASAQDLVGPTHGSRQIDTAKVKGHALPKTLHGRTLPRHYAKFTRYHYSARYRCWLCFATSKWYYWYDPFQSYLPVALIATYPPTAYAAPPAVVPAAALPPVVAPPVDAPVEAPPAAPLARPRPPVGAPPTPGAPVAPPVPRPPA
jgi:hypothetical protein